MILTRHCLGLLVSRLVAAAGAIPVAGNYYFFTATQFLLRNIDTGRYYLLQAWGDNTTAQLLYETEVVSPVAAPSIPHEGDNFEFTADGFLRIKHESSGNFHTLDIKSDSGAKQTLLRTGVGSDAGSFAASGNNYLFSAGILLFKDVDTLDLSTLALAGPHGEQQIIFV